MQFLNLKWGTLGLRYRSVVTMTFLFLFDLHHVVVATAVQLISPCFCSQSL